MRYIYFYLPPFEILLIFHTYGRHCKIHFLSHFLRCSRNVLRFLAILIGSRQSWTKVEHVQFPANASVTIEQDCLKIFQISRFIIFWKILRCCKILDFGQTFTTILRFCDGLKVHPSQNHPTTFLKIVLGYHIAILR